MIPWCDNDWQTYTPGCKWGLLHVGKGICGQECGEESWGLVIVWSSTKLLLKAEQSRASNERSWCQAGLHWMKICPVYQVFAYLKKHPTLYLTQHTRICNRVFISIFWLDRLFMGTKREEMPPRMPKPRAAYQPRLHAFGIPTMQLNWPCVTRRSHTLVCYHGHPSWRIVPVSFGHFGLTTPKSNPESCFARQLQPALLKVVGKHTIFGEYL